MNHVHRPRSVCLTGGIKRQGYPREDTPTPTPPPLALRGLHLGSPSRFPCDVYEAHLVPTGSPPWFPRRCPCDVYEPHLAPGRARQGTPAGPPPPGRHYSLLAPPAVSRVAFMKRT